MAEQKENSELILRVENHSKIFPQVVANNKITLDVRRGEIHCLLGENGAGKSTLAECLYGVYRPDGGHLFFKGAPISFNSPRDAIRAGIGMVHQHFVLAPPMSVIENIVVGTPMAGISLKLNAARERVRKICDNYGICLDLNATVGQLSVGQQQWVEILKALYLGVELLILDEPTAVLTPQEIERLFSILRKMKADGLSVILITHKLKEVMEISDRVTVLRKGLKVATVETSSITREDLACMMVGREVIFRVEKETLEPGDVVLELRDLHMQKENHQEVLHGVNLKVHSRQIVGLAGVAGNGQRDLFDAIVGVRQVYKGQIFLDGQEITNLSPRAVMQKGVASIPQDRIQEGLLMDFTVEENLILGTHWEEPFCQRGFLREKEIARFSSDAIDQYDIAAPGGTVRAKTLSGGNLQKVILARELSHHPRLILASSPTRGLDVGATEYVHRRLVELRSKGAGVLLISEDLDEILNLSDVVAVIFKGQIMGIFPVEEARLERIGLLMAGIAEGA